MLSFQRRHAPALKMSSSGSGTGKFKFKRGSELAGNSQNSIKSYFGNKVTNIFIQWIIIVLLGISKEKSIRFSGQNKWIAKCKETKVHRGGSRGSRQLARHHWGHSQWREEGPGRWHLRQWQRSGEHRGYGRLPLHRLQRHRVRPWIYRQLWWWWRAGRWRQDKSSGRKWWGNSPVAYL